MKELKNIEDKLREKIDSILDCFDFEKVHKVMKFLNWQWAFSDSEDGVPEIYELRIQARKLLNETVDSFIKNRFENKQFDTFYTSCGGFHAQIAYEIMTLSFHVEEWCEENILNKKDDEV